MTQDEARQMLVSRIQKDAYHEAAATVREIEAKAREEGEKEGAQYRDPRHPALRVRPRGGEYRFGDRTAQRRYEGPHHRPRGPQHPRASKPPRAWT